MTTRSPTSGRSARQEMSAPVPAIGQEMANFIEAFWRAPFWSPQFFNGLPTLRWAEPALDMSEEETAYILTAELPGLRKDDIEITLENGAITIAGEKRDSFQTTRKHHQYAERRYGVFRRTLPLPADAKRDGIEADFADGVLSLTIPKVETGPEPVRIELK